MGCPSGLRFPKPQTPSLSNDSLQNCITLITKQCKRSYTNISIPEPSHHKTMTHEDRGDEQRGGVALGQHGLGGLVLGVKVGHLHAA